MIVALSMFERSCISDVYPGMRQQQRPRSVTMGSDRSFRVLDLRQTFHGTRLKEHRSSVRRHGLNSAAWTWSKPSTGMTPVFSDSATRSHRNPKILRTRYESIQGIRFLLRDAVLITLIGVVYYSTDPSELNFLISNLHRITSYHTTSPFLCYEPIPASQLSVPDPHMPPFCQ